jgi:hypothetical protein
MLFETLARLHRAGKGTPDTGFKTAGSIDPVVVTADKELGKGSGDDLIKMVSDEVASGINKRFSRVLEKKKCG